MPDAIEQVWINLENVETDETELEFSYTAHSGLHSWRLEKQSLDFWYSLLVYEKRGLQLGHLGYTKIKFTPQIQIQIPIYKSFKNQSEVCLLNPYISNPPTLF